MARLLIEHGADANWANGEGRTPLMAAAAVGLCDVARLLLDSGAGVNAATPSAGEAPDGEDETGWTPLLSAVANCRGEVARLLLELGADVTARTSLGNAAPYLALASRFHSRPVVGSSSADASGRPITVAASELAAELLDAGAPWCLQCTPALGETDRARALLDAGADANAAGERRAGGRRGRCVTGQGAAGPGS